MRGLDGAGYIGPGRTSIDTRRPGPGVAAAPMISAGQAGLLYEHAAART
jgi:hypothetical protein